MLVRFTKHRPEAAADAFACVRPDGTTTIAEMPRRGILPHAAVHFVVETTLGCHDAFFGRVARGEAIDEVTAKLHGQSGAWAKMTQAMQTEALVECLEMEQWSGTNDPAGFAEALIAGCRRRGAVPPEITAEEVDRLRVALREFGAAWRPLAPGGSLERTFGT